MYEILGAAVNNSGVYCFRLRQCRQRQNCGRKITVAASFYPMAEFARAVGGSHAEVYTMIGDGIDLTTGNLRHAI